jgi:hypothetical protein
MAEPKSRNQGEGDKESDRKYRERTEAFVNSERGQKAIERAGKVSEEEARKLRKAEKKGKSRSRGEDPQIQYQTKR